MCRGVGQVPDCVRHRSRKPVHLLRTGHGVLGRTAIAVVGELLQGTSRRLLHLLTTCCASLFPFHPSLAPPAPGNQHFRKNRLFLGTQNYHLEEEMQPSWSGFGEGLPHKEKNICAKNRSVFSLHVLGVWCVYMALSFSEKCLSLSFSIYLSIYLAVCPSIAF